MFSSDLGSATCIHVTDPHTLWHTVTWPGLITNIMGQSVSRRNKKRRKASPPLSTLEEGDNSDRSYNGGEGSRPLSTSPKPKLPPEQRPVSTFDPIHGVQQTELMGDDLYDHDEGFDHNFDGRSQNTMASRGVNGGIHLAGHSPSKTKRDKNAPHYAYAPEAADHSAVLRGLSNDLCREAMNFVYSKCSNNKKALCVRDF